MPHDPAHADQLFHEALQRANQMERHAYLTAACGGNTTLWNDVWDRLQHDPRAAAGMRKTSGLKGRTIASPAVTTHEGPNDLVGSYRLVKVLGEGGASVVWQAEETHTGAQVAMKIINTDARGFLERFERQLSVFDFLDHPEIVKPLGCGATPSGKPFILMECLQGVPITRFCDDQRLPLLTRVQLFVQACAALHHAHLQGLVHGGIKPSNLLLHWSEQDKPILKIVDFGVARALNFALAAPNGTLLAPPAYFSPEHAREEPLEARSDLYSMGVLLYELLAGRMPFEAELTGASVEGTTRCIREIRPLKPSACLQSVPKAQRAGIALNRQMEPEKMAFALEYQFDAIVMRALEKFPSDRYPALSAMVNDMQQHQALSPEDELYQILMARPRNWAHNALGILKLVALIIITLGGTFWITHQLKGATQSDSDDKALAAQFQQLRLSDLEGLDPRLQELRLDDAAKHLSELAGHPAAAADVQEEIGLTYMALAQTADAQTQLEGALEKRKLALGPEHPDTLRSATEVATVEHALGQHAEAEQRLRPVLATQKHVLGPNHPDTHLTIRVLAAVCEAEDKPLDAQTMYLQLYQVQKQVLGPDHLDTLSTLSDAARTFTVQGQYEEAIKLRSEHLEGMQRTLGAREPRTLVSMSITAATLEAGGRQKEAEQLFTKALAGMQEVLGADHPDTQRQMEQVAAMQARRLQHAEAIRMRQQIIATKRRLFGADHPQTLQAMHMLADACDAAGQTKEALETRVQILNRVQTACGPEHPDTLACMEELARYHADHGRHAEAVKLYEQVLDVKRRRLGADSAQTLRAMHQLAQAVDAAGKTTKAEALELQTLKLTQDAFGPGDPDTLHQMRHAASILQRHGKFSEAENIYRQMLRLQQSVLGPDHDDTLDTVSGLAASCLQQGRMQEADDLYYEVLQRRLQDSQPIAASIAATLNLGSCRLMEGKYAEADVLLREGLNLLIKHAPGHWLRFHTESLLGAAKLAQQKPAESKALLLSGCQGLTAQRKRMPKEAQPLLRDALSRLVVCCESISNNKDAARWTQKIAEFDQGQ